MSITSNILTDTLTLQSTTLTISEIEFFGKEAVISATTNNTSGLVYYAAFASEQPGITDSEIITPTGELDSGFVEAASGISFTVSGGEYLQRLYVYSVQDDAASIADPVISSVSVTETADGATITWSTDIAASGRVDYGATSSYGLYEDTVEGTSHSITITGLGSNELVHYQISALTAAGGSDIEADATFTTLASATPIDFTGWNTFSNGGGSVNIVGSTAVFSGNPGATTFVYPTAGNGIFLTAGVTYKITLELSSVEVTTQANIVGTSAPTTVWPTRTQTQIAAGSRASETYICTVSSGETGEWCPAFGPGATIVSNDTDFVLESATIEII